MKGVCVCVSFGMKGVCVSLGVKKVCVCCVRVFLGVKGVCVCVRATVLLE